MAQLASNERMLYVGGMKTSAPPLLTSTVAHGVVPVPSGLNLADGATVLVVPLEWLATAAGSAQVPRPSPKIRHRFASEDMIGCFEGDGKAATSSAARSRLRQRAQSKPQ